MSSDSFDQLFKENYGMLRFVSLCLLIYGGIYLFYGQVLIETVWFDRYLELSAALASSWVNTFTSLETTTVYQGGVLSRINSITVPGRYVIVAQGCDASIVFAVLVSTISAWPGRWLYKLPALVLGIAIMFGLNILRIAGMAVTETLNPDYFDLMHEWVLPTLLIVGALVYFYLWTLISSEHPDDYHWEDHQTTE